MRLARLLTAIAVAVRHKQTPAEREATPRRVNGANALLAVACIALAALAAACAASNDPDITAVDYGAAAWESNSTVQSGRHYYVRHCTQDMEASWAAGEPQWEYLDCMAANGAFDGKHPKAVSVKEWRDRQVAWEAKEAAQRQVALLEMIRDRLSLLAETTDGASTPDIANMWADLERALEVEQ